MERPGRRPAVQQLQDRGLHLEVAEAVEGLAQRPEHGGLGADHVARLLAHDEVDVAAPDAGVLGEVLVQGRQRAQRLGRHLPGGGHDGQLAAAAAHDPPGDGDLVAQVDVALPRLERVVADLGQAEHDLQPLVALLQRGEGEPAGARGRTSRGR